MPETPTTAPDIQAIKARMKATWSAGDFGVIARQVEQANRDVVDSLNLAPGTRVLDVACGTGNSAIPAAQRGAVVTGVDIAPNLLEQARARAAEARVAATFQEGDAEALAFPDGAFDVVISVFGAMFAPRPELVAKELTRVVRPGGRIVMANWIPTSFIGESFRLGAKYVPPPPGMPTPLLWGDEATVRQRLHDGIAHLDLSRQTATFVQPVGEEQVFDEFRRYFGPTIRTLESLDDAGKESFHRDSVALWKQHNQAKDGTVRVTSEYLRVIATKA